MFLCSTESGHKRYHDNEDGYNSCSVNTKSKLSTNKSSYCSYCQMTYWTKTYAQLPYAYGTTSLFLGNIELEHGMLHGIERCGYSTHTTYE